MIDPDDMQLGSPVAQIDRAEVLLQNGSSLCAVLEDACSGAWTPRMVFDAVCSVSEAVVRLLEAELLRIDLGRRMYLTLVALTEVPLTARSLDEAAEVTCERLRAMDVVLPEIVAWE